MLDLVDFDVVCSNRYVYNIYWYCFGVCESLSLSVARFGGLGDFWGVAIERENERWGAGVETQKNVRGEIGGWGRVPFHENYAPSLSTIYDGA